VVSCTHSSESNSCLKTWPAGICHTWHVLPDKEGRTTLLLAAQAILMILGEGGARACPVPAGGSACPVTTSCNICCCCLLLSRFGCVRIGSYGQSEKLSFLNFTQTQLKAVVFVVSVVHAFPACRIRPCSPCTLVYMPLIVQQDVRPILLEQMKLSCQVFTSPSTENYELLVAMHQSVRSVTTVISWCKNVLNLDFKDSQFYRICSAG
jgi:hypothetical protein